MRSSATRLWSLTSPSTAAAVLTSCRTSGSFLDLWRSGSNCILASSSMTDANGAVACRFGTWVKKATKPAGARDSAAAGGEPEAGPLLEDYFKPPRSVAALARPSYTSREDGADTAAGVAAAADRRASRRASGLKDGGRQTSTGVFATTSREVVAGDRASDQAPARAEASELRSLGSRTASAARVSPPGQSSQEHGRLLSLEFDDLAPRHPPGPPAEQPGSRGQLQQAGPQQAKSAPKSRFGRPSPWDAAEGQGQASGSGYGASIDPARLGKVKDPGLVNAAAIIQGGGGPSGAGPARGRPGRAGADLRPGSERTDVWARPAPLGEGGPEAGDAVGAPSSHRQPGPERAKLAASLSLRQHESSTPATERKGEGPPAEPYPRAALRKAGRPARPALTGGEVSGLALLDEGTRSRPQVGARSRLAEGARGQLAEGARSRPEEGARSRLAEGSRSREQSKQRAQSKPFPAARAQARHHRQAVDADLSATAPAPRPPWDQLLYDSRHAASVSALAAAIAANKGRPVSAWAAAEALGSLARMAGRGALTAPNQPARASDSFSAASKLARDLLPILEPGLHTVPPQVLPPLLWSLPKLHLRPSNALLEALLRELLTDDIKAVRCRGNTGLLMVSQGLLGLCKLGALNISAGTDAGAGGCQSPLVLLPHPLSGLEEASPGSYALGWKDGVMGAQSHSPALPEQRRQPEALASATPLASATEPVANGGGDVSRTTSEAPPALAPTVGHHGSPGGPSAGVAGDKPGRLASLLLQKTAEMALTRLHDLGPEALSGLSSSLAQIGYRGHPFFDRIADEALLRLGSMSAVSLGILLRSLAATGVHKPELLRAAEPLLLDGVASGEIKASALPELICSYAHFGHACPHLLPLAVTRAMDCAGLLGATKLKLLQKSVGFLAMEGQLLSAELSAALAGAVKREDGKL